MSTETVDVSKLKSKGADTVRLAVQLGWRATNHNGSVLLTSPVERGQRITIPTSNINQARGRAWVSKLIRYGDPVKVLAFNAQLEDMARVDKGQKPFMEPNDLMPLVHTESTVPAQYSLPGEIVAPEPTQPRVEALREHVDLPTETVRQRITESIVVKTQPWMAKRNLARGQGNKYQSHAVIERTWSDGHVDYACAGCGDGYVNDKPRSVSMHYANSKDGQHPHHTREEHLANARATVVVVPEVWTPATRPVTERAERLAREMRMAMEQIRDKGFDLSSEEKMLEALAEQMVRVRDEKRGDDEQRGPLTAEQVVERVRRLVDGGAYVEQQQRVEELELAIIDEQTARMQAEARAFRLKGEWDALRELMNGGSDSDV